MRHLLALCLTVTACVTHRGDDWTPAPDPTPPRGPAPAISLVLLGDAGAPTEEADATAARLADLLARTDRRGPRPIVLWLGNNTHSGKHRAPCPPLGDPPGPRSQSLRDVVLSHVKAGGSSFAVAGEVEWTCGLLESGRPAERPPFERPAAQYVVSVAVDGSATVHWTCSEAGCREREPHAEPWVELVMVDTTPWVEPVDGGEPTLRALDHMLEALTSPSRRRPPRILVSHLPVEAAGEHGSAGYDADATIHTLYPPLRDAVLGGQFDGVLAAHDNATYAAPDLSDAIKRSDKMWTAAPLWQVVAGAVSMPISKSTRAAPKTRYFTSIAHVPDVYSPRPGFAVVQLGGSEVLATLHAKGRHWETATLRMPLRRALHAVETESPNMAPCPRCPDLPASER